MSSSGGEALRKRIQPTFGNALVPVHIIAQFCTDPAPAIFPLISYASLPPLAATDTPAVAADTKQPPPALLLPRTFRVLTWNVLVDGADKMNGVDNSTGRLDRVRAHLACVDADLVCLQEVTPTSVQVLTSDPKMMRAYSRSNLFVEAGAPYGSLILSKVPFQVDVYSTDPKAKPIATNANVPKSGKAKGGGKPAKLNAVPVTAGDAKSIAAPPAAPAAAAKPKSSSGTHKHFVLATVPLAPLTDGAGSESLLVASMHLSAGGKDEAQSLRIKELTRLQQILSHRSRAGTGVVACVMGGDYNFRTALDPQNPMRAPETRILPDEWTEARPPAGEYALSFDPGRNPLAKQLSRSGLAGQFDHIFSTIPTPPPPPDVTEFTERAKGAYTIVSSATLSVPLPVEDTTSDHYPVLATIQLATTRRGLPNV